MRAFLLAVLLLAGCSDPAPAVETQEPTYQVVLNSYDETQRITASKAIREETGLTLSAADKHLREPPSVLVEGITKGAAEAMARRLAESGVVAEVHRK